MGDFGDYPGEEYTPSWEAQEDEVLGTMRKSGKGSLPKDPVNFDVEFFETLIAQLEKKSGQKLDDGLRSEIQKRTNKMLGEVLSSGPVDWDTGKAGPMDTEKRRAPPPSGGPKPMFPGDKAGSGDPGFHGLNDGDTHDPPPMDIQDYPPQMFPGDRAGK